MKVEVIDEDNTVVYLNKNIVRFIDFSHIEKDIDIILKKLKDNYGIKTNGCFNIVIYQDKKYGAVLELTRDGVDYLDYLDNYISVDINKKNCKFLYEFDWPCKYLKNYIVYNNKFYTDKFDIKYCELCKVIYNDDIFKINNEGKKI